MFTASPSIPALRTPGYQMRVLQLWSWMHPPRLARNRNSFLLCPAFCSSSWGMRDYGRAMVLASPFFCVPSCILPSPSSDHVRRMRALRFLKSRS